MIDAENILEGAYYAMEQAGRLLTDAVSLYEQRRWPSSLVLAVFSMEELGKAETLYRRALDAEETGAKSVEHVMSGQSHHATKLREGRGLLTIDASVGFWGEPPDPDSPENAAIMRQLAETQEIAVRNAPREAHQARMRALYVDLGNDEVWIRPVDTPPNDAYLIVSAANIEYGERKRKFIRRANQFVAEALRQFHVPDLPESLHVAWPR